MPSSTAEIIGQFFKATHQTQIEPADRLRQLRNFAKEGQVESFRWGSCQYDEEAGMFHILLQLHHEFGLEYVEHIIKEWFKIDYAPLEITVDQLTQSCREILRDSEEPEEMESELLELAKQKTIAEAIESSVDLFVGYTLCGFVEHMFNQCFESDQSNYVFESVPSGMLIEGVIIGIKCYLLFVHGFVQDEYVFEGWDT